MNTELIKKVPHRTDTKGEKCTICTRVIYQYQDYGSTNQGKHHINCVSKLKYTSI